MHMTLFRIAFRKARGFLTITSIGAILAMPQAIAAQNNSANAFADYLHQQGEYYRAISEYQESLFLRASSLEDSCYCYLKIASCYYRGKDYEGLIAFAHATRPRLAGHDSALRTFNNYEGLGYLHSGSPSLAGWYFQQNKNHDESALLLGIAKLYLADWTPAREGFLKLTASRDPEIAAKAARMSVVAQDGEQIGRKNPLCAGVLSALVPGAGYLYTKNYQTAASALILNALFLGSSLEFHEKGFELVSITSFAVAFGWYAGNVFGSAESAKRYNRSKRHSLIDTALEKDNILAHY